MDVIGVAPTGSGKTLAFLLPALVHVMAQPELTAGEGPIALFLEPTRELVQQTFKVAERFCERTVGDDKLRVRMAFGGVDPTLQLPCQDGPDKGRWPEFLVSTPGRFLDLVKRWQLSAERLSYVVLDEADLMLSPGTWLPTIRNLLTLVRPDRQLLFFSATWPDEADVAAKELCGDELIRVRVDPPVPPIPQSVYLFHHVDDVQAEALRLEALIEWLRSDLREDEALLVMCMTKETARQLSRDGEVVEAVGGEDKVVVLDAGLAADERQEAYWSFVQGRSRVMFTTFALGSRGLDYADPSIAAVEATPLSLVVLLFDFPRTIRDYAHCIGRTARPGQLSGRAVSFLPEMRFWIARELVALMENSGQQVPGELRSLVDDDKLFVAGCRNAMLKVQAGEPPSPVDAPGCAGLTSSYTAAGLWTLPASVPSYRRKLLHWLADEVGVPHVSTREDPHRTLHIARSREILPDKFFVEGEEVWVARKMGEAELRARVVDPKIKRTWRTVRLRFEGGAEHYVSVDLTRPCTS